jgi:hypothetical protein
MVMVAATGFVRSTEKSFRTSSSVLNDSEGDMLTLSSRCGLQLVIVFCEIVL